MWLLLVLLLLLCGLLLHLRGSPCRVVCLLRYYPNCLECGVLNSCQIPHIGEQGKLEFGFMCDPKHKVSVGCQRSGNHLPISGQHSVPPKRASPPQPPPLLWEHRAATRCKIYSKSGGFLILWLSLGRCFLSWGYVFGLLFYQLQTQACKFPVVQHKRNVAKILQPATEAK